MVQGRVPAGAVRGMPAVRPRPGQFNCERWRVSGCLAPAVLDGVSPPRCGAALGSLAARVRQSPGAAESGDWISRVYNTRPLGCQETRRRGARCSTSRKSLIAKSFTARSLDARPRAPILGSQFARHSSRGLTCLLSRRAPVVSIAVARSSRRQLAGAAGRVARLAGRPRDARRATVRCSSASSTTGRTRSPASRRADFVVREDGVAREVLRGRAGHRPGDHRAAGGQLARRRTRTSRTCGARSRRSSERLGGKNPMAVTTVGERPTIARRLHARQGALREGRGPGVRDAGQRGTFLDGVAGAVARGWRAATSSAPSIVAVTAEGPEFSDRHYSEILPLLRDERRDARRAGRSAARAART